MEDIPIFPPGPPLGPPPNIFNGWTSNGRPINVTTENPIHTADERGNTLFAEGAEPVIRGIRGRDLMESLHELYNEQPPVPDISDTTEAWTHRQQQMSAFAHVNPPIAPAAPTWWRPPYAYVPLQANVAPAIFTHPRYANVCHVPSAIMDSPIATEIDAVTTGVPMARPFQSENRHVHIMTDQLHNSAMFRTGNQDTIPPTAYHPATTGGNAIPPGIFVNDLRDGRSSSSNHLLNDLESLHRTQQTNLQRAADRANRWKGKGKGVSTGKGKPQTPPPEIAVHQYDGTDTACSICLDQFERGQPVYRLACNHLFHEGCWDGYLVGTEADCDCPNCRGPPIAKSLFKHLGRNERDTARLSAENLRWSSPAQSNGSGRSFQSTLSGMSRTPHQESVLMTADQLAEWSQSWSMLSPDEYFRQREALSSDSNPNHESVHIKTVSKTKLTGDKLSILVDLGSKINVIGKETEREFATRSAEHGLETVYVPRKQRLYVSGVGSDSATCDYEAIAPIAVKFEDQAATKESFRANIAQGCGEHLPAILGLTSMKEKDAVLLLRAGKEMIVFPGPGGYKIEWSPGTKLLPMIPSPSGHMVIPCDRFAELATTKDNAEGIALWTDHMVKSG